MYSSMNFYKFIKCYQPPEPSKLLYLSPLPRLCSFRGHHFLATIADLNKKSHIMFLKPSSCLQGLMAVHWTSTIESCEEYNPCQVAAPKWSAWYVEKIWRVGRTKVKLRKDCLAGKYYGQHIPHCFLPTGASQPTFYSADFCKGHVCRAPSS